MLLHLELFLQFRIPRNTLRKYIQAPDLDETAIISTSKCLFMSFSSAKYGIISLGETYVSTPFVS
jgi:hypothetical protein